MKYGEFLNWLRKCLHLPNASAGCSQTYCAIDSGHDKAPQKGQALFPLTLNLLAPTTVGAPINP